MQVVYNGIIPIELNNIENDKAITGVHRIKLNVPIPLSSKYKYIDVTSKQNADPPSDKMINIFLPNVSANRVVSRFPIN